MPNTQNKSLFYFPFAQQEKHELAQSSMLYTNTVPSLSTKSITANDRSYLSSGGPWFSMHHLPSNHTIQKAVPCQTVVRGGEDYDTCITIVDLVKPQ